MSVAQASSRVFLTNLSHLTHLVRENGKVSQLEAEDIIKRLRGHCPIWGHPIDYGARLIVARTRKGEILLLSADPDQEERDGINTALVAQGQGFYVFSETEEDQDEMVKNIKEQASKPLPPVIAETATVMPLFRRDTSPAYRRSMPARGWH